MKRFLLPILSGLAILALFNLSSCGKVDCDETPEHEDCPPIDTETTDTTKKQITGNLVVIVKNYIKPNPVNNDKALAVLGASKEDMLWFSYASKGNPQRPTLVDAKALIAAQQADTFYSWQDNYTYNGKSVGAIKITAAIGTYFLHVLDGELDKYVGAVSITADATDDTLFVETRPLGSIVIQTRRSSIAGTEVNDIEWRAYGTTNDTFNAVAKTKTDDIDIEPYYKGVTYSGVNERGLAETGVFYLADVNAREYMFMGYSSLLAPTDGRQAKAVERVRKNSVGRVLLAFTN